MNRYNNNTFNEKKASQEWESNFKSTLNRLSTQYLLLLRSASSEVALEEESNGGEEGNGAVGGSGSSSGNGNGSDPRGEEMNKIIGCLLFWCFGGFI